MSSLQKTHDQSHHHPDPSDHHHDISQPLRRESTTSSTEPSLASSAGYFTFPVTHTLNGILRRISDTSPDHQLQQSQPPNNMPRSSGVLAGTASLPKSLSSSFSSWKSRSGSSTPRYSPTPGSSIYAPAPLQRTESPFQPPPLTPLRLTGHSPSTKKSERLLSVTLAEEIRLLVPAALQLVDEWRLVFSLERDGVSLRSLYDKCEPLRSARGGFVLVLRDESNCVFGAYLTHAPHPSAHFYGTGECFLYRATILPSIPDMLNLPPPPSADTTHATRMTTLSGGGTDDEEERIRFKAFPYSGVNDYLIFCQSDYLSVGGGDGHYGLWVDDNLEKGISSGCPTFGNEPLSEDGTKFNIMGVELWYVGAS